MQPKSYHTSITPESQYADGDDLVSQDNDLGDELLSALEASSLWDNIDSHHQDQLLTELLDAATAIIDTHDMVRNAKVEP